jgi:hypothetical protein
MTVGLCTRCKKGKDCGFRQPGTWVVECALFDEKPRSDSPSLPPNRLAPLEHDSRAAFAEDADSPAFPATTTRRKKR